MPQSNAQPRTLDTATDQTGAEEAAAATSTMTDTVREATAESYRQIQDSVLRVVRSGEDATLAMFGGGTGSGRLPLPFGPDPAAARAAVRGGYDLFEQLLAGQRQFVDRLIAEQRRFVEALLTPPPGR